MSPDAAPLVPVNAEPAATQPLARQARQESFEQFALALRRTMLATPAGWALVAGLVTARAPASTLVNWLALFLVVWGGNLWALRGVIRQGCDPARHQGRLKAVALADGMAWGLMVPMLATHDHLLYLWLVVVLCGVVSVNMPAYITWPRAFLALLGSLWTSLTLSFLLPGLRQTTQALTSMPQLVFGLLVYFGLLAYTMSQISGRAREGIRMHLENAAIAEQLRQALAQMAQQATTDALTGQLNRRALDSLLLELADDAEHRGRHFAVLMLDIDHFKQINDTHGHAMGDDALRLVAQRVAEELRAGDRCARYGGEEFVVVLPHTQLAPALEAAERIRQALARAPLATKPPLTVTASIGVAASQPGVTLQALMAAADEAVYAAKRRGRNRVCALQLSPRRETPVPGEAQVAQPGA